MILNASGFTDVERRIGAGKANVRLTGNGYMCKILP
jgi:hypothetical protein